MNALNVLLGLILVCACGILYLLFEVVKQQGRLLLRLDGIEVRLGLRQPTGPAVPAGLAVGAKFPSFKLPDLAGKEVALEDFLGKPVLLINWSPQCGYCAQIAPELARMQATLQAHDIALVLAAYGDAGANRKLAEAHGLNATVLLQKDAQTVEAFNGLGTPVAYLVDEERLVRKPLAVGAEQVPKLIRQAAGFPDEGVKPQQNPGFGPGTELKKLLGRIGIHATPDCPCNDRALLMDRNGCDWCEQNLDTIVGWLYEEATRRGLPFVRKAAEILVKKAISKARSARTNVAPPREDLILMGEQP